MTVSRGGLRRAAAGVGVLLALGAALTGCGGDGGDGSSGSSLPKVEPAREPARIFTERLAKLLETTRSAEDCTNLEIVNGRSFVSFRCPAPPRLAASMGDFEVEAAEEYGTGAVVDYRSRIASDGAAIVLFVSRSREWAVSRFGLLTEPSVGTSDRDSREEYVATADAYLAAVRERDCRALQRLQFDGGPEGETTCQALKASTKDLAKRLERDPGAQLRYDGGNATFGFASLETARPEPQNLTISVLKDSSGSAPAYQVLNAAPSLTSGDLRRATRAIHNAVKKRRKLENPDGSEPSSGRDE